MNIEEIKTISIRAYLKSLGILPQREYSHSGVYFSPFRSEKTPSFKVDYNRNLWIDYGTGEGGSIIDLIMKINGCDFYTAVKHLRSGNRPVIELPQPIRTECPLQIHSVTELKSYPLLQYLAERMVHPYIARQFCKEVSYTINGKQYYAVGFPNDKGGYELRNKYFKVSSSPKGISTIRRNCKEIMIFEGFIDMLSFLYEIDHEPPKDILVLNSTINLKKAIPVLKDYEHIHTYLDHDTVGRKATENIQIEFGDKVIDRSDFYSDLNDLNDYIIHKARTVPGNRPSMLDGITKPLSCKPKL